MSEADSLWYLRHRDGVEHGPFQLADLVSAAQAGNVAADTCVRHDVHTRAQWVFATRVQPIAQVMPREAEAPAAQAQSRQVKSPQAQPRPARQADLQPPPKSPAEEKPEQPAETAKPAPVERPASVFRDSRTAVAKPVRETTDEAPEPSATMDQPVAATSIRPQRDPAFPVPKSFVHAVQTLFLDFQFKRFVTPWIVRILWAISLLLAVLTIVALGYNFFLQPSMSATTGTDNGNWQFGPMNEQPLLLMRILIFMITSLLITMIVLCIRVVCEMVIVVFQAGGDVRELRKLLKQPQP